MPLIEGDSHIKKEKDFDKLMKKKAKYWSPQERKALDKLVKPKIEQSSGLKEKELDKILKKAEYDKTSGIRPDRAYHLRKYGK